MISTGIFLPDFPDSARLNLNGFDFLELSGELLDLPIPESAASILSRIPVVIHNLFAGSIFDQLMASSNLHLRQELESLLLRRLNAAVKWNVRRWDISLSMTKLLHNPAYRESAINILQTNFCHTMKLPYRSFRLTIRIPDEYQPSYAEISRFRRELNLSGADYIYELHPHEPAATEALEPLLGHFGEADEWRISFDPAAGNRLNGAMLDKIIQRAVKLNPNGVRITLAPMNLAEADPEIIQHLLEIKTYLTRETE